MIETVLSTLSGGVVGLIQNVFEKKQETKRFEIQKKLENEENKDNNEAAIKIAETNLDTEKYKSVIAIAEQNKKEYTDFTSSVVELNTIDGKGAKFIRPMYAVGFFVMFVAQCIYFAFFDKQQNILEFIVHYTAYTIDYILGFYFVRRGKEKFDLSSYFGKKKSI